MTLLGVAALYNATGETAYRDVVLGCVDRLASEWIFLTGGMSSGERYVPRRFYHPRNEVEVCPQHTWILLLDQALRWTGDARYATEIERDLFNHFLAAQLADGSNWSYMTPLNGRAQEPTTPNCCNAAGQRIAGRMPIYLYGLRGGAPATMLITASQATLRPPGLPAVVLRQETRFPSEGTLTLHVEPEQPARFPLHVRIPPYAVGATARVGDEAPVAAPAGDFLVLERTWRAGDAIRLSLPLLPACQADEAQVALMRGPLVYAYFQDAQADPVQFHGLRGLYPEDVVLHIDPDHPEASVEEVTAGEGLLGPALRVAAPGEGLLGPALRVAAHVRGRAPLFATPEANAGLPRRREETLVLLPFANQGAVRGEYAVFMAHS